MATRIAIDTAKLMMKKLQGKLDALYEEQESLKGFSGEGDNMCRGGRVKVKKMQGGGKWRPKPQLGSTVLGQDLLGDYTIDPSMQNYAYGNQLDTSYNINQDIPNSASYKEVMNPWERFLGWGAKNKIGDTASKIGYGLGVAAPVLYNLGQGLRKPDLLDPKDFYNPYRNQAMSLMANRRVNVDPMLEANKAAQANYSRNVKDVSGGSRSKVLGGLGAGLNQRMSSDASALAYKQNADLGYMGEEAQFKYGVGQDMSNIDFGVAGMNQEAWARKRGYLGQAATDFSKLLQVNKQMQNQTERDRQLMDIYPDIFGNITEFMPWVEQMRVKLG